jgi:hypothetical protein
MSDEGGVEKVLVNAGQLKYLGPNRAFLAILFALWAARKKPGQWGRLMKLAVLTTGLGGYGYWTGFFS